MTPRSRLLRTGARAFALAALASFAAAGACLARRPNVELGAQDETRRYVHDARERSYILHRPLTPAPGPRPLVFALHGGGGSARNMIDLTGGRLNALADRDGFYVVYPDGVENGWNDGRRDIQSIAHRENIDDVGFLRGLVAALGAEFSIDARRIAVAGISNGGMMSYRLACEAPEFRLAVPVASQISALLAPECRPPRPITVVMINGEEDPIVPYAGGPIRLFSWTRSRGEVLSTDATYALWMKWNACAPAAAEQALPDRDPADGTRAFVRRSGSCAGGVQTILYRIQGGGHAWPGGWAYLSEGLIGRTSRDLDVSELIAELLRP